MTSPTSNSHLHLSPSPGSQQEFYSVIRGSTEDPRSLSTDFCRSRFFPWFPVKAASLFSKAHRHCEKCTIHKKKHCCRAHDFFLKFNRVQEPAT